MVESFAKSGDTLPTAGMARMMALDRAKPIWSDSDMAELLRHQLNAPVVADLRRCGAIDEATLSQIETLMQGYSGFTFRDVLFHPAPPLPVLLAIKTFGKFAIEQDGPLPPEIAYVLYYCAIVAALLNHGERITSLKSLALCQGAEWVIQQPWTEPSTREFLIAGLTEFEHSVGE